MMQKKFVFRHLRRYTCTCRIQFTIPNIHVVSFPRNNAAIFVFDLSITWSNIKVNLILFEPRSMVDFGWFFRFDNMEIFDT